MRPAALLAALLTVAPAQSEAQHQTVPSDSTIRVILRDRVDARLAVGIIVGVLDADGRRRVIAYGASGTTRPLDVNTVFELGSTTKLFTATLLAEMVRRGEVQLDDPVSKFLAPGVKVPSRNGRQITLLDLVTHSSGLPRNAAALRSEVADVSQAGFTPEALLAFLSSHELRRDIGAQYEYSNLGFMLLSHALTQAAGVPSYDEALRSRVLVPLRLQDTRTEPTPSMRERVAPGHDESGTASPPIAMAPTLAGVAMLRSTMSDMLDYLAANMSADMDSTRGGLIAALRATHSRRREAGRYQLGLAWHRQVLSNGDTLIFHEGGTGGYKSFVGYDPVRRTGVVLLANSVYASSDIALHLLDAAKPLAPPRRPTWAALKAIALPATTLDQFVGTYTAPGVTYFIARDGDHLTFESTAQSKRPLYAEKEDEFFLKGIDVRISFQRDGSGQVTGLVLRLNGRERTALKSR